MNDKLLDTKVNSEILPIEEDSVTPVDHTKIESIEESLSEIVLNNNFDTFSFLFELLEYADVSGKSIEDAFRTFTIDSVAFTNKYKGSNCAGLSLFLKQRLEELGIQSRITPSHGDYLSIPEADRYVQIRTVDLVSLLRDEVEDKWIFLAPGLTIDKPMIILEDYSVTSFGVRYTITDVTNEGFNLTTVRSNGDSVTRYFRLEELTNPDESSQKSLLRCRTIYQITRQYENKRDQITYNLIKRRFRVKLGETDRMLSVEEFLDFLNENELLIENIFCNAYLVTGLKRLIAKTTEIIDTILIPVLREHIKEQ